MTLNDLEKDVYRRVGLSSAPDSASVTRIRAFLNETYQDLLGLPGVAGAFQRDYSPAVSSIANQALYRLSPVVRRVRRVWETTNDRRLTMRSLDWYRSISPDQTAITGTPEIWVPFGGSFVQTQPADGSQLFVKSTDAADTTQKAYVEGFTVAGYYRSANVTLTGTTAVSVSAAIVTWIYVTNFYLDGLTAGNVTLHEDSGAGTVLETISIGSLRSRRQAAVILWPTPSAVIAYTLDVELEWPDLAVAQDEPILPVRFHRLLAVGARMKEYERMDDTRYAAAQAEYLKGLRDLKFDLQAPPDYRPKVGRPREDRSRLGPWYPADPRY